MSYEICQVPSYKINYANSKKITKSIETISAVLNTDLQFHERLGKNDNLKLSVDVDKLRLHNPSGSLENIFNNICDFLKVEMNEISYTTNFSVETGSHHIVIPKYFMNSTEQKELWKEFKNIYKYGKEIDADVFGKDQWFRLPNQTKEGVENTEHIIQNGELDHFVLKYVEKATLYKHKKVNNQVMRNKTECCLDMRICGYAGDSQWCDNCGYQFGKGEFNNILKQKQQPLPFKPQIQIADITDDELSETNEPSNDKYLELLFDVIGQNPQQIGWDLWFQIAGCLKSNNYDKNIFLEYSKPNDKTNKASELWEGIRKTTMSIHTLQSIAKQVNLTGYKIWLHKYEVNLYSPLFTSGLIADYFKTLYGDKFLCCDEKVYKFNGVYWETMDKKNSELTNFVDKVFVKDLIEYANEQLTTFTAKLNGDQDHDDIVTKTITKISLLLANILTLRKVGVRKAVMEDIVTFITNNKIEFDANPYLFAFNNCVFDLKLNKFITPLPEYHITKTAGYDYDNFYSQERTQQLEDIINTIFPDEDVKNYYLSILATGLCGLQIENLFIATGTGGNGKSLINSLMLKSIGDYGYKMPSNVLLSAIKTGPNPEVALIHNKRFILTQEPNNSKKICCSTLKEITGDKTLNVRDLYSSKCSINLKNTTLIEANEIPSVDEVNDAIFRRLRTIPFLSQYVTADVYETLDDKLNVFVANSYYKTDEFQDNYKQALFILLIQRFKAFVDNNHSLPNQPKKCLDKCSAYLGTCDDIFSWFESYYEKTATIEQSEAIPLADIYKAFSASDFFSNLSKSDKRKYNKKYFLSKLEENIFIRKFIKLRNSHHNNTKQSSDYIVGWQKIATESTEHEPEY